MIINVFEEILLLILILKDVIHSHLNDRLITLNNQEKKIKYGKYKEPLQRIEDQF